MVKIRKIDSSSPWAVLILILFQIITLVCLFFNPIQVLHLKNYPEISPRASLKKSCHAAMLSILSRRASKTLFAKTLIFQMEREDYGVFDFLGKEEVFDVLESKKKGRCTAIITDRVGVRFFSFYFENSNESDHIYGRYITRIDEITNEQIVEE